MGITAKDTVYDNEIAPLMAQIIGICNTHKIDMIAHFDIGGPEDPDLRCTSAILDEDSPRAMIRARWLLCPEVQE